VAPDARAAQRGERLFGAAVDGNDARAAGTVSVGTAVGYDVGGARIAGSRTVVCHAITLQATRVLKSHD
jgi:hypothetical protein